MSDLTIRPVDLQVLIPRVTEVGKNQHITDHQDTLQQQQFAGKWQHVSANRQKQVQGTTKSEEGKVQEKNSKEQSHSKDGQKQQDVKHSKTDAADMVNHASNGDPVRGNLIDIKT